MLITPEYVFKDVTHITPEWLAAKGITALVLDIDNTLTADRSQELPEEVAAWIAAMRKAGVKLTIVSNGAEKRVRPFAEKLGLAYLYRAAKPLPFALMVAQHRMGVKHRQMAMVGDQLYADRMVAALYGIPGLMVIPRGPDLGAQVILKRKWEKSTGRNTTTGEVRPCERSLEDPVRHRRHQRQLCCPRLQKQSGRAGVYRKMGLNAFEYQCGRGVRLGLDKAARMAALAAERDILFSVHAPYYISMSSLEEDKRLNSIQYLLQSAAVCRALGGRRIIFHSGSCGKQSREAALEKALDTMRRAVAALDEAGFSDMTLCPETMGKVGQLGTLDEVLALCSVDSRITPCIDFGHLNARTLGGIRTKADYAAILDRMTEVLGDDRARQFHVHFPASSTRRAAKSATGPLPIRSSARSPSP